MLMVVFGAGASFDSAPSHKPIGATLKGYRPPLADDLFDGREEFRSALKTYPQIQPIVPYLRERETNSLEEVLQELYENAAGHPARSKQMMALRFYIREVISRCSHHWTKQVDGVTNHKTLVDQILERPSERVLFVTFNYDDLIEQALADHEFRTEHFEDYIVKHHKFALFKLHGCITLARLVGFYAQAGNGMIVDEAARYGIDGRTPFRICDISQHGTIDGQIAVPAIAIPVNKKSTFECPPAHIKLLVDQLPHVDKMLAIGWRAKEAHFLSLRSEHIRRLKALWVVSKNDAGTILRDLQNAVPGKYDSAASIQSFERGFSDFVTSKAGRSIF